MSKGLQTRETVLREALAQASHVGLKGITIGTLADALEMSKSGLFAHFRSKEQLQVDVLDHASRAFTYGSKMGIDATRKLPEEGFTRAWPKVIAMDPGTRAAVDAMWPKLGL